MAKRLSNKFLSLCCLITIEVYNVKAIECGSTHYLRPLITYGQPTQKGEWPFLTALFKVNGREFFCGGNLISDKHVLTAAHCIQQKGNILRRLPADIFVLLGAYDLTLRNDTGVLQRNVRDIYVHHDWNVYSDKYDADVAVLLLDETVQFTNNIRPVCMPPDNAVTDSVNGSVVGWGLNEDTISNVQFIKRTDVNVLKASSCYTKDYIVAAISSIRTFCGQGVGGTPNEGDSGGGFYVLFGSVWVQYGIVSSARKNAAHFIDADAVTVYTNVMEFKSWIVERVSECGSEVSEAKMIADIKIHLKCDFGPLAESDVYECRLFDLDMQGANFAVATFTGVHQFTRTNDDVECIRFFNGTMFSLPSGIGKLFKNLRLIAINGSIGMRSIRRSNLKNLENLAKLWIAKNDIVTLDRHSLWDLPNLEEFRLDESNLREIDGGTFEKNLKLSVISLHSNQLEVLPSNLFQHNVLLEGILLDRNFLKVIDERTFGTNRLLKEVMLYSNQLEILPTNLFQNNSLLIMVTLHDNSLKIINEDIFVKNEKLRRISLYSNELEVLPSKLFQKNLFLESVSFEGNFINVIDGKIFETNIILTDVDLSSNRLEVLPWNLFQNNLLLELVNLKNNSLSGIDGKIFEANAMLKAVDLSSNRLEVLPSNLFENNLLLVGVQIDRNFLVVIDGSIFQANAILKEVFLSSNRLEALHWNVFQNNLLLDNVGLHNNSLSVIDERTFEMNTKVRKIDLSTNQLQALSWNLFLNNSLLESLTLEKNSLKVIDEKTFEKNTKLQILILNSNQFEIIPRKLLENNLLLQIFSVSDNSLKSIDERTFETNAKLSFVDLSFNKLEILSKNLFQNNFFLENVNFAGNVLLKIIEIDFSAFSHVKTVNFLASNCVNGYYDAVDPNTYLDEFENLTDFLRVIKTNCSVPNY